MEFLKGLNEEQQAAVSHRGGPLLVIAGPGTGKTLTIVSRILYLVNQGISPDRIAAITFTNKAAQEIRSRVMKHLNDAGKLFIGTFHKLGLHILKRAFNLDPFVASERETIEILSDIAGKDNALKLKNKISYSNNTLTPIEPPLKPLFDRYKQILSKRGLMDIDDILLHTVRLLKEDSNRLMETVKMEHLIIDEYQDINPLQYRLIRLLIGPENNIFAVGDADQCIYSFRGSSSSFFLRFQEDFPHSTVVKLTKNYRTPETILKAATSVINASTHRIPLQLSPSIKGGKKIAIFSFSSDKDEADYIAKLIKERAGATYHGELFKGQESDRYSLFSDFAILVRTHSLSSTIKKALIQRGIPVRAIGEKRLSEFDSTRVFLDYLRAVITGDERSLLRILNIPPRGLGHKSIDAIKKLADEKATTIFEALSHFENHKRTVKKFFENLTSLLTSSKDNTFSAICREIVERFQLYEYFSKEEVMLEHMLSLSHAYDQLQPQEALKRFYEEILAEHEFDMIEGANFVPLLSIHAAKGLEFPVVIIAGVEDGIIPYRDSPIDEERRLFYVAMTRAKEELIITHVAQRFIHGSILTQRPSPFLLSFGNDLKELKVIKETSVKKPVQKRLFL